MTKDEILIALWNELEQRGFDPNVENPVGAAVRLLTGKARAGRDRPRWAERLASEGGHHIACFLAQQVAEKELKAFLYAQGAEIVLGHSV